jgi:hypothetical protein
MDGAEDVFDVAYGTWAYTWQWSRVTGRGPNPMLPEPTLNPRTFDLSAGTNTLVLRARESNTRLDRLIITSELGFVPTDPPPLVSFANSNRVTISSGQATPYPSTITVSGLTGVIAHLEVTLEGLEHTRLDDLDILLVGPQGQKVMLMSDAGGEATNLTILGLTFVAGAPPLLDAAGFDPQFAYFSYAPADYEPGESLPSPTPPGPYGTSLSVFNLKSA